MDKEKDEGPFPPGVPRELGKGEARQKLRRDAPPGQGDLLTAKDLFGEIIDDLGDRSEKGVDRSPSSRSVSARQANASSKSEFSPDTVTVKKDPSSSVADSKEHYSIVDLAYSALLQDSKLDPEGESGRRNTVSQENDSYGQYLLLDRTATGGMAEIFRAKRRGVTSSRYVS